MHAASGVTSSAAVAHLRSHMPRCGGRDTMGLPSPSPGADLWTGRKRVLVNDHTLNGLIRGFIPNRSRRGTCGIKLSAAGLHFFVAEALGFRISWAVVPEGPFHSCMRALFPATHLHRYRARLDAPDSVDVVFLDSGSCPDPLSGLWAMRRVPAIVGGELPPVGQSCGQPVGEFSLAPSHTPPWEGARTVFIG
jgi:hypothetical protein